MYKYSYTNRLQDLVQIKSIYWNILCDNKISVSDSKLLDLKFNFWTGLFNYCKKISKTLD